jgi:hypothetical protein
MSPPSFNYSTFLDEQVWYLVTSDNWSSTFDAFLEAPEGKDKLPSDKEFFLSDVKKCVVKVRPQFFHVIYDVLGFVATELDRDPSIGFVFDFYHTGTISNEIQQVYDFLYKCLDSSNVRYSTIKSSADTYVEIKNFYYPDTNTYTMYTTKKLIEFIRKAVPSFTSDPYKKVYLSRGKAPNHNSLYKDVNLDSAPPYVDFFDDVRLDDERKLEVYLESEGFEIVYPEDFNSLEDQIKFMSEVKVVASCTSAGLLNTLFMQDGQTMLEFQVPLVALKGDGTWDQSLHDFYHPVSYVMKHEYVSIPAMRSVDLIIDRLTNRSYLKELICS